MAGEDVARQKKSSTAALARREGNLQTSAPSAQAAVAMGSVVHMVGEEGPRPWLVGPLFPQRLSLGILKRSCVCFLACWVLVSPRLSSPRLVMNLPKPPPVKFANFVSGMDWPWLSITVLQSSSELQCWISTGNNTLLSTVVAPDKTFLIDLTALDNTSKVVLFKVT
jgi:hypothetical protein